MKKLFLLTHMPGEGWVEGKSRIEQPGWTQHADFMNNLAASGFVVLGGPISDTEALLLIDSPDKAEIRTVFTEDPWHKSKVLEIKEIQEWTILLEHGKEHKV
jgi:uncharacterized protein YciI